MRKLNDPAQQGEAINCFLAGCNDGHTATALRAEVLERRFCISSRRAHLIAAMVWGGANG